jgi:hypothetical protein
MDLGANALTATTRSAAPSGDPWVLKDCVGIELPPPATKTSRPQKLLDRSDVVEYGKWENYD